MMGDTTLIIEGKVRSKMKIIMSKDVEARNFIVQLQIRRFMYKYVGSRGTPFSATISL